MFSEITDKNGNMLYLKDRSFYLYLKDKGETRKLGAINPKGELFIRRYNKHIFRKLDAYGFNYALLKQLSPDMRVVVKQEDGSFLRTRVLDILTLGDCKQFIADGFELQIFMPRGLFIS